MKALGSIQIEFDSETNGNLDTGLTSLTFEINNRPVSVD
jgi:hypothetical protein